MKKLFKILAGLIMVLAVGLIGIYGYFDQKSKSLTNEIRTTLETDFIDLPDGAVHYEFMGPSTGDVVVLVHGFSVPYPALSFMPSMRRDICRIMNRPT